MRIIDLATWPRRRHFELFRGMDYPHFGLCADVDLSVFRPAVRAKGLSFTVTTAYVLARAANEIPEFRLRIRGEQVVEHEVVHPSFTVLNDQDLFSFCSVPYRSNLSEFAALAVERMARVQAEPVLSDEDGQDDLLFMTSLPWVSFTSMVHPIHMHPADSVPRIAWGKFFEREGHIWMPVAVQAHHALMDGVHVGRYYQRIQELFDQPESYL
ncbi:chloramphenicol O-acetyltransferase [Longilinea arvoryzae]|uniref:Chloramphenicol O-acetyltransferase n=1 Tax=Longilinea arvoryzae TaxID=360412 RepID=A0A0S7BBK6_9CHLR|nr:chloramphenicol acetyltransferase [Longilinea arvoryzae]GAP12473.1 chloramphenicol O-acetyltransferase [Longilinea arvoryzae]